MSSEGRTASAPYTRKKGVSPVAGLGVVRLAHSTAGSSLIHPFPVLCENVVGPGFEPLQYLRVGALDLPIALRMSDRGEAELDAKVLAVVPEQGICELSAIGPVWGSWSLWAFSEKLLF